MSNNIGSNEISNFFVKNYHSNKISFDEVKKLGIDVENLKYADTNDDNCFDLDEILDDNNVYAAFVSVVSKDLDDVSDTKDKEKEKDDENKVQKKNDTGGA